MREAGIREARQNISALLDEVREGRFREDLFYRLNVIEVRIPALRERTEDLPLLIQHFVKCYAAELGRETLQVDPEIITCMERYPFPGNVRELENLIERAVTLSRGDRITLECLPGSVLRGSEPMRVGQLTGEGADLDTMLAEYKRTLLLEALERAGGVKKKAAGLLGISFRSFRYRFEKLRLASGEDSAEE